MAVDEFHTIPGADYEQVFGELSKYGANMILATQTLARLDRLTEGDRSRDLRAAVFSNLDGLFAFHTSAEDAEYLAEELGGGLDKQDLLELGHYQCYVRMTDTRTGERLPTFTVQLDAPPVGDPAVANRLAAASAEQYGRDSLEVELDLQAAAERINGPRPGAPANTDEAYPETAVPAANAAGGASADRTVTGPQLPRSTRPGGQRKHGRGSGRERGRRSGGDGERGDPQQHDN